MSGMWGGRLFDHPDKGWVIRLVCLFLAMLIWGGTKLSKPYAVTRSVALDFSVPPGWQFDRPPPAMVEVTAAGTGWALLGSFIRYPRPSAEVPLLSRPSVILEPPELAGHVRLGTGIRIDPVGFRSLELTLDSLASKRLPVVADVDISFDGDFVADTVRILPDTVTVYGPGHLLDTLMAAYTNRYEAAGLRKSRSDALRLMNPQPDLLSFSHTAVTFQVEVSQVTEKILTVPVESMGMSDSIRFFPPAVTVTCRVATAWYDALGPSTVRVVADFEGQAQDLTQRSVPVKVVGLPPWVSGTKIHPMAVEYLLVE